MSIQCPTFEDGDSLTILILKTLEDPSLAGAAGGARTLSACCHAHKAPVQAGPLRSGPFPEAGILGLESQAPPFRGGPVRPSASVGAQGRPQPGTFLPSSPLSPSGLGSHPAYGKPSSFWPLVNGASVLAWALPGPGGVACGSQAGAHTLLRLAKDPRVLSSEDPGRPGTVVSTSGPPLPHWG